MTDNQSKSPFDLAAVDLGSNSFHMIVARIENGHVHVMDRLKEMVRLGAGLDEQGELSSEARERALVCLQRFGERVKAMPQGHVAAVGTNTLRQSKNARSFLKKAEAAIGHPISIISGMEEARLIYLGVSHSLASDSSQRFVMDIGGGSTELIIGKAFEPIHLESMNMGCVSISRRYFKNNKLSAKCWKQANTAAHLKLRPIKRYYRNIGWDMATGASGTIKAVGKVINRLDLSPYGIKLKHLYEIRDRMIDAGTLEALDLPGLKDDRKPVFAGGLAVLIAVFEALDIEYMQVSDGALREGLLYERLGRIHQEDTRLKTIEDMQRRFQLDETHAYRVSHTAHRLFSQICDDWNLNLQHAELLNWAASLHEIGLAISHSNYHKHGAYLLDHADLPGFSIEEQDWMSVLVRCHRKKISEKYVATLLEEHQDEALKLGVLLRLAVLLHRSRKDSDINTPALNVSGKTLQLKLKEVTAETFPLLNADLQQEISYLQNIAFKLEIG